jgi:hypothetical protein
MDMEDGDTIEVFTQQTGGSSDTDRAGLSSAGSPAYPRFDLIP